MRYRRILTILLAVALLSALSGVAHAEGIQPINRLSFVYELYHSWGVPGQVVEAPFTDVSSGDTVVAWAYASGIILGDGAGHFMPDEALTREQAAVMLARYATFYDIPAPPQGISGLELRDYLDISDWAIFGVDYCYNAGIIPPCATQNGIDLFAPQALITEADALSALQTLLALAGAS